MSDSLAWLTFFLSAAAVVIAGTQLAGAGDRIARETGIGGLWIGLVLIASATSLPELVTDTTAAIIEEPDLAVGDLFGSSMANMLVLAIIDIMHRGRRVWRALSMGNALVAALAIALTSFAAAFIGSQLDFSIGHVGLETVILAALYILGTRVVFQHEYLEARRRSAEQAEGDDRKAAKEELRLRLPSRSSLVPFAASAVIILAAAPFLASSAADISEVTGIERSFVGVVFVAITTSLPELATAIAAVRIGAYDLAAGNLFGSNAFNMFVLLPVDIAYTPGPVLRDVSQAQLVAASAAMFLTATGVMGIIYRAERRFFLVEPDAAAMVVAYLAGVFLIYQTGA